MVIIRCADCGKLLQKKEGFDCDASGMKCPDCGCESQDVDIEC